MTQWTWIIATCGALALSSCASGPDIPAEDVGSFKAANFSEGAASLQSGTSEEQAAATDGIGGLQRTVAVPPENPKDYRIGPQDLLEIKVFGVPDLDTETRVSASGFITMPLIGLVDANGLTYEELAVRIAGRLGQDYLQNPNVTVNVKEYASQRVTMEGAVGKPGIFALSGDTTLLQSIALAGGLAELAEPRAVRVFRTNEAGEKTVGIFDLTQIREGKAPDLALLGGDVVVVPRNDQREFLRDSLFRDTIDLLNPFRLVR